MLHPAAAAEVEETYRWYEAAADGYGDEYLSVFEAALDSVCADPGAAPLAHGDLRRLLLKRFPQVVYYRVIDEQVVVLACWLVPARS